MKRGGEYPWAECDEIIPGRLCRPCNITPVGLAVSSTVYPGGWSLLGDDVGGSDRDFFCGAG